MKICVSIGHGKSSKGGYDSGAVGGGYHEFKIAREIGKYIGQALSEYDCAVDVINYDATLYLTDRIAYVNNGGYDLAMEIHLNAGGGTGSEVYYKHTNAQGKKLAAAISKSIANTFGIRDRGAKVKLNNAGGDYFGFVRSVKCQSLLIETVFIDTNSDRKKVEGDDGRKACGNAIARAVVNFYGLKAVTTTEPTKPSPTTGSISVGDTVEIIGTYYATGQKIPAWVKLKKHTVKSISGSKALLKEINSWVLLNDLRLVKSASISIGSTVTINKGAVYGGLSSTRGKAVPAAQLAPKKHTVSKIQTNNGVREALLKDISSWVAVASLTEV